MTQRLSSASNEAVIGPISSGKVRLTDSLPGVCGRIPWWVFQKAGEPGTEARIYPENSVASVRPRYFAAASARAVSPCFT